MKKGPKRDYANYTNCEKKDQKGIMQIILIVKKGPEKVYTNSLLSKSLLHCKVYSRKDTDRAFNKFQVYLLVVLFF